MSNYTIPENHEIISVSSKCGTPIPFYDDAFGKVYAYRTADFEEGLVRADTWESAWEIVEDEILKPIPDDEIHEAYGYYVTCSHPLEKPENRGPWRARHDDNFCANLATLPTEKEAINFCMEHAEENEIDLAEGYSYQSNVSGSGIVYHCLNGEWLDLLTDELLAELGWIIETQEIEV